MIYRARENDVAVASELAYRLWPDNSVDDMIEEFAEYVASGESAVFIAYEDDKNVGFAQCGLRHDYVEGTNSSPVGYLEGIYVDENYRGRGIARALLAECENWAQEMGCTEFASDCELDNTDSLNFHLKVGFAEENRIICFTKKL